MLEPFNEGYLWHESLNYGRWSTTLINTYSNIIKSSGFEKPFKTLLFSNKRLENPKTSVSHHPPTPQVLHRVGSGHTYRSLFNTRKLKLQLDWEHYKQRRNHRTAILEQAIHQYQLRQKTRKYYGDTQDNFALRAQGIQEAPFTDPVLQLPGLDLKLHELDFQFNLNPDEFRQSSYNVHQFLKLKYPKTEACCTLWRIMNCAPDLGGCGKRVGKPENYCGEKHYCPICAYIRASETGGNLFERLFASVADEFLMLTFTIPDYLSKTIWEQQHRDKKTIYKLLKDRVKQVMHKLYPDLVGYYEVVHEWHSKNPLSIPHLHVHIIFPCLTTYENKHGELGFKRFRAYIADKTTFSDHLEQLRRAWTRANGYNPDEVLFVVNHRYAHRNRPQQLRHMCNYMVRRPILDINNWLNEHQPEIISGTRLFWLQWLLDDTPPNTYRVTGRRWYSNGKIGRLMAAYGTSLAEVKARRKKDKEHGQRCFCPHCAREISKHEWARGELTYCEQPPPFAVAKLRRWPHHFEEVAT